jgi:hypothetical protein
MRERSICDPATAGLIPERFAASVSGIDKKPIESTYRTPEQISRALFSDADGFS